MPIFEYRCKDCGRKFEFYHKANEAPVCPACGSCHLSKLFSTFSGRVKGESSGRAAVIGGSSSCAGCSGGSCSTCK